MTEINMDELAMTEEVGKPTNGPITVITHSHDITPDPKLMWPPEVYQKLAKLSPLPRVLTLDSVPSGYRISNIGYMIPVNDFDPYLLGENQLDVLGADIIGLWQNPGKRSPDYDRGWNTISKTLKQHEPNYDPNFDTNASLNAQIGLAYGIEGVGSTVVTALIGRVLLRLRENKHKAPPLTRREFLKIAALVAIVPAISIGRLPIFIQSLRHIDVASDTSTVLQAITRVTRPISFHSSFLEMRNAKLGLATMDRLSRLALPGASASIILGNLHRLGVFPGQLKGETLEQTKTRLTEYLRLEITGIVKLIKSKNYAPPLIVEETLIQIFARYDRYYVTQTQAGIPKIFWSGEERFIPEVVNMIREVVKRDSK